MFLSTPRRGERGARIGFGLRASDDSQTTSGARNPEPGAGSRLRASIRRRMPMPLRSSTRARLLLGAAGALVFVATAMTGSGATAQEGAASRPAATPDAALLRNYTPVTADRLLKPEEQSWLMVRRTYDGWGYSDLSDITPANV